MGRDARRNGSAEKARRHGYKKVGTVPSAEFIRREHEERRNVLRSALIVGRLGAIAAIAGAASAVGRRLGTAPQPVVTKLRQRRMA